MSGFRGRSRRPAARDPYPIEDLLQDVRELRLTLAADLHAAAAAAEDGAAEVASDIVGADRDEVARFRRLAEMRMSRLQGISDQEPETPRWRRRAAVTLPAVPLVGAMALSAAAVTGVLPLPGGRAHSPVSAPSPATSNVAASLEQLQAVVDDHDASAREVIAAATALHRQLAALIAGTSNDPAQAAEVAELLQMEQDMLLQAQPPGASVVLDATRRLAAQLVKTTSPTPKLSPASTTLPKPLATSSPKSTKTSSPSPSSTKQSSTPKPSASSSPSSSSSSGSGQIPAVP
ncbi:MAG TPA: hypothetical protein VFH66_00955 [Mycobacteriales bacterium]|nr:hypothetical protein [Mycobacteriales bacterium]